MSWSILVGIVLVLGLAVGAALQRRHAERRTRDTVRGLASARERGTAQARLQYPHVDLARCLGCGTCVRACPEEGVLDMAHGQAVVVHGARCVGHGRCAEECPTGAIAVRLGDLSDRRDIPVLTEGLEAQGVPGLFLAGEVTGFALIRTAIEHGRAVAAEVALRVRKAPAKDVADLCIVGAGPAGIACSLEAKSRGLDFVLVDQEELGGTVAKYPRRKLVMTQPIELPLLGRLKRTSYSKEELMELWRDVAERHELPLRGGVRMRGLQRERDAFRVDTDAGPIHARNVCLALGRRGTPRKLGVPGEERSKVAYSLLDACSYQGRRVLVVGGGDSAVEAALGLAEQPGNRVTLSYRRDAFSRLRQRNEARLLEAQRAGAIQVLLQSQVAAIDEGTVTLHVEGAQGGEHGCGELLLENDEVFVMIGGEPPFPLLSSCGVSFDPALRVQPETLDSGRGSLVGPLGVALGGALLALFLVFTFRDYYGLGAHERARHALDPWLRSSGRVGLPLGIGAAGLVLANLAYLLRRSGKLVRFGALSRWMTTHVVTGVLALVTALLHAAMAPGHTVGGHALLALCVLVGTGAVGRWFYSFVPRAANGRELALVEVQGRLAALAGEWDRATPEFAARLRDEIDRLIGGSAWHGSFLARLGDLLRARRRVRAVVGSLVRDARAAGLAEDHVAELRRLSAEAQRAALTAAHYEDVRGLLATWRYLHRWVALLMVLLLSAHVVTALRYAEVFR